MHVNRVHNRRLTVPCWHKWAPHIYLMTSRMQVKPSPETYTQFSRFITLTGSHTSPSVKGRRHDAKSRRPMSRSPCALTAREDYLWLTPGGWHRRGPRRLLGVQQAWWTAGPWGMEDMRPTVSSTDRQMWTPTWLRLLLHISTGYITPFNCRLLLLRFDFLRNC